MLGVVFFSTGAGREPVLDWLRALSRDEKLAIGTDLKTVQYGFPIGMPLCRSLGDGLFEVRSTLPTRKEARMIFLLDGDDIVILNGFIKKAQKTPAKELDLARKRKRDYLSK